MMPSDDEITYSNLRHIGKRLELISLLREISDIEIQKKLWIDRADYPNSSGIDEVIHFFFDDTDLADNPERELGYILIDNEEIVKIRELVLELNEIIDKLGDASSKEYIFSSQWERVVSCAKGALKVMELP